jgi:hypothetical protein
MRTAFFGGFAGQLIAGIIWAISAAVSTWIDPRYGMATLFFASMLLYRQNWFFPASMIVVGAHYLPFVFLYGMRQFAALAAMLIIGGVGIGLYANNMFSLGGWAAAGAFIAFAFVGRGVALREERDIAS